MELKPKGLNFKGLPLFIPAKPGLWKTEIRYSHLIVISLVIVHKKKLNYANSIASRLPFSGSGS